MQKEEREADIFRDGLLRYLGNILLLLLFFY